MALDELEVDGILSTNSDMLGQKGSCREWWDEEAQEWVHQWSGDYLYKVLNTILGNVHAEHRPSPKGTPPREVGTTPGNPYYWFFGSQGVPRNA